MMTTATMTGGASPGAWNTKGKEAQDAQNVSDTAWREQPPMRTVTASTCSPPPSLLPDGKILLRSMQPEPMPAAFSRASPGGI